MFCRLQTTTNDVMLTMPQDLTASPFGHLRTPSPHPPPQAKAIFVFSNTTGDDKLREDSHSLVRCLVLRKKLNDIGMERISVQLNRAREKTDALVSAALPPALPHSHATDAHGITSCSIHVPIRLTQQRCPPLCGRTWGSTP